MDNSVKLRSRKRANGLKALYFELNVDGARKYEYLKLYLVEEKTKKDKQANKETMAIAYKMLAEKEKEVSSGLLQDIDKKLLLVDWLEQQYIYYKNKGGDRFAATLHNTILYVKKYKGADIRLSKVNKSYALGFIEFITTTKSKYNYNLSPETVYTYYVTLSICLNRAVRHGKLSINPFNLLAPSEKPPRRTKKREYLSLEELQRMINTDCGDWRVKFSFLFCCFTGLRWSDVSMLRWKDIKEIEKGKYQLEITQKKTKEILTIPLSENALKWLPEKGINGWDNKIYQFGDRSIVYKYLKRWADDAGINKNIIFHTSRHTYATLLLYYGADIYTVSKLLGHTSIKTTEIYAKVVDESKRKATDLIPSV